MAWEIRFSGKAKNSLASMDATAAKRIKRYLEDRIATDENPRRFEKHCKAILLNSGDTGLAIIELFAKFRMKSLLC